MTTFVAGHFTKPQGLVEPRSMFPGEDDDTIRTRFETYIAEGLGRVTAVAPESQDAALIAWVYHRAFFAVFVELSGSAGSTAMADQGSAVYSSYQIQNFKLLSDKFLAEYNLYVAAASPTAPLRSFSVSHTIAYR